jgi:hypothetical protein
VQALKRLPILSASLRDATGLGMLGTADYDDDNDDDYDLVFYFTSFRTAYSSSR